ncbi:phosphoheptose isomerase [Basilea psittacipulmonis]|uniref:Phosphoheptose isomerase n=1 Tax=Basilea psittacipulmonis DSM 24701 TaxID=1072685 RepID=A0A077DFI1_9BURK|nr:phosphoheptose isomerase [Basilea psittacipulmonis]AIL32127.1 phosphoheptose isomerase [Basilea psittacipulmonis DSM 24701]
MNVHKRIESHFDMAIANLMESSKNLSEPLVHASNLLINAINNGHKILACGNGGSASDSQHFIAELVGRFERDRIPLAGIALTTDTSIMTAVGNDYSFDEVFSRQVQALGLPGDVLVAISTSGNSKNVIHAIEMAHEQGIPVIALTGKGGGKIAQMLTQDDVHLCVPHDRTMRIQEVHIMILHILCDLIDGFMFGDKE